MADLVTTKPMRSQRQWRFLFASGKPFARRWAHETPGGRGARFRRLPVKVRKKAPNYGARAGQTIAGNLRRGSSGKFESASSPGAARLNAARDAARRPKKTPPRIPGRRRAPAKTEAQRAQEREAKRQARLAEQDKKRQEAAAAKRAERDRILAEAGLGDAAGLAGALIDARDGNTLTSANGQQLAARGLAEQGKDGSYRLTPAGREVANAASQGDAGRVRDTMGRAADRAATQRERSAQRMSAAMARAAKPKPAKGGGGGKKPKQPPAVRRLPTRSSSRPQAARAPGGGGGGGEGERRAEPRSPYADLAKKLGDGQPLSDAEADTLIRNGLARRNRAGSLSLTASGQRATREKAASGFVVFKDARGQYRWVGFSSNAYRDRDREIVSTKALADDCARADADGSYGPLRWWHVGGVVGAGWDLGSCDFNAMHGRVLVESGTFKSAAIGQAVAKAAPHLQLSIGFTHAPDEPDRQGVFHHIRRFERSLVPSGRAANPFTRLIVKETHMDAEKEAALKATLGDAAAGEVLAGAEATQKDADAQGVAYKADDLWSAVTLALKSAVVAMLAPPPPPPAEPIAAKAADPVLDEAKAEDMPGEMVVEETVEPVAEDPGEMTYDEFVAEIRRVVREEIGAELKAQLAPLAGMLDIEKKVSGAVQSLMQPYQAQKDSETAAIKERLTALEGDVPSAFQAAFHGYRPSQDAGTVVAKDAAPGGAPPPPDPGTPTADDPFADIRHNLFGSSNGRH